MKEVILWFLHRRWMVKAAAKRMNDAQRAKLLSGLTENKMIPATGVIQSDAVFLCRFHDPVRFNRHQFMSGWRWAVGYINLGSHGALVATELVAKSRRAGDYSSFNRGAELAVQQHKNKMGWE